ncbi:hypothetical protein JCM15519_36550 [Fundidesulfovibrio butyratiphilus]
MTTPSPHTSSGRRGARSFQDTAISIQSTLRMAFMIVTVLMAVAMCLSSLIMAHQSAIKQAKSHLGSVAAIKGSALLAWNGQLQADMGAVLPSVTTLPLATALLAPGPNAAPNEQRQEAFASLLAHAAKGSAYFTEFLLVGPKGLVEASSRPGDKDRTAPIPASLLTGQSSLSTVILPPSPGVDTPEALVVRPILDASGRQIGLLAGKAPAARIQELLGQDESGASVRTFLTNTAFLLLVPTSLGPGLSAGSELKSEGARLANSTQLQGDGVYTDASGLEVVGVWRLLAPMGVALFVEQPLTLALSPMRDTIWTALTAAVAMVLAAFMAAGPLAAFLSTPLKGLAEAARRIARGELESRAQVQGQAEVRLLAESFNYMAARLAWRIEAENLLGAMAKSLLPATRQQFLQTSEALLADLCRFLRAQRMVLAVYDHKGRLKPFNRWPTPNGDQEGQRRVTLLLERATALMEIRSAVVLPGAPSDDPEIATRGLYFAAFAPVVKRGAPWGALCTERISQTAFDQDEMSLLERAGEILGMAVERVKAEAAQEATESKYRQLFENAAEAIFQTTTKGAVLNANPAAARLLGYDSPAEMIRLVDDMAIQHYAYPEMRREVLRVLRDEGEVKGFEILFRDAKGQRIWGSVSAQAVLNEKGLIERLDVRADDITARKAAESQRDSYVEALASKNEDLVRTKGFVTDIFDSMPSFLVSLDKNGVMTEINREATRVANLTRNEALDRDFVEVFPALGRIMNDFHQAMTQGTPLVRREVLRDGDGTRHLDVVVYPLAHGEGGAVVRVDDVTERVRIEEMMVQSEKMLSVGGLAAGMAHEINNPLAGILHSAQVIERRLSPDMKANRQAAELAGCSLEALERYLELRGLPEFLKSIQESGQRAAKIVSNMLEFSRLSVSALMPHDLHQIIEQALELAASDYNLQKKFDFKHIAIVRDYATNLPPAPCAPTQIQQVLLNILGNAAQAMALNETPDRPPRITVRTRRQGNSALIEIGDNGPGMDENTRRRVFEPFFTTKPVGMGTGLGLSVSYFIITRTHGGGMSVESSPGSGSIFRITLPLQR